MPSALSECCCHRPGDHSQPWWGRGGELLSNHSIVMGPPSLCWPVAVSASLLSLTAGCQISNCFSTAVFLQKLQAVGKRPNLTPRGWGFLSLQGIVSSLRLEQGLFLSWEVPPGVRRQAREWEDKQGLCPLRGRRTWGRWCGWEQRTHAQLLSLLHFLLNRTS